jgi:hypothetical protein
MTTQTKIIVVTAALLAVIDIAVRVFLPTRTVVVREVSAPTEVVTTRMLRIVDDRGSEKAVIRVDKNGEAGLLMFDRNGAQRLQLDTFQQTPSLILMDREERRRVYFGMDTDSGDGQYDVYEAADAPEHTLSK